MSKVCPICNFEPHLWEESKDKKVYRVGCHPCGQYMIEKACANDFRRKYLSFDTSTIGGKELYDHNMKLLRSYIAQHHNDIINDSLLSSLPGMYMPRK